MTAPVPPRPAPLTSIIMSSYKQEGFVAAAIESVLAQTLTDWELVVVDDGSPDASHARALPYAARDARIRAWQKPNGGHCSALIFGLAHTHPDSRYLMFLDGDDFLEPDYLAVMTAHLENHPAVGLVCCEAHRVDAAGQRLGPYFRSRWAPGWGGFPRNLDHRHLVTPFVTFFCATGQGMSGLYRRSTFARTAGWDLRFTRHEDTDMLCQMALIAEVHHLPQRLYNYRIHAQNVTYLSEHAAAAVSPSHRPGGYQTFRDKWDHWPARDAREQALLDHAYRYYYRVHRPLRLVRVAGLAFREFLQTRRWSLLRWAGHCLGSATLSLFSFGIRRPTTTLA